MARVERGCFAIADISGYTKYLTGVALEHSHDVLADLMNVVVSQMRGALHLAKLEGDAVFCYGHDGETDGAMLLTMAESCYFAFAQRILTIQQHTTCECDACRLIPRLSLKFLAHHGEYIREEIAGSPLLVGTDAVVVHRLLKNSVTQKTGLRGYAFFTQACVRRFALDPLPLRMIEHQETYEDVGEIRGYVYDLEARWQEEQARRVVYVARDQDPAPIEFEVPVPPPVVWEFLTSPRKRPLWQVGVKRMDQYNPRGIPGVGTTNHCVHGKKAFPEEILDWKPFRYFTIRRKAPFLGEFLGTAELTPIQEGTRTHVSTRGVPNGGPVQRLILRLFGAKLHAIRRESTENLVRLLSTLQPSIADQPEIRTT